VAPEVGVLREATVGVDDPVGRLGVCCFLDVVFDVPLPEVGGVEAGAVEIGLGVVVLEIAARCFAMSCCGF
jgi:hypothetical protein